MADFQRFIQRILGFGRELGIQNLSGTPTPHPGADASIFNNDSEIAAFKTITSILAGIERSTPVEIGDNMPSMQDSEDRHPLKLSDSFGQLAVGIHEVVAVTTRIAEHNVLKVLITKNYKRDHDDALSSAHPKVMSPSEPGDLQGRTGFEYMVAYTNDCENYWKQPSLSTHLWILSDVLSTRGQSNGQSNLVPNLARYIAARSFRKIQHRFNSKNLSLPYFKCLDNVKAVPFMHQPIQRNAGGDYDKMELNNDQLLLDFKKCSLSEGNDDFFGVEIPNIAELVTNPSPKTKTLELYTNKTSTEFHMILLCMLQRFQTALNDLVDVYNERNDTSGKDPNRKSVFNENVRKVHLYGYGLLRISRGRAFQLHLENIEASLQDPLRFSDEEESDGEGYDDELGEIPPALPQAGALAKSYTAWLRLIVAHLDATEIVAQYIHKFQCNVSVDILVPPKTDQTLLPWQELFSGQYLPNRDNASSRDFPSHDDIRLFLEEGVSRARAAKQNYQLADTALTHWAPIRNPKHEDAKTILNTLHEDYNIQGQVRNILVKISEWEPVSQIRSEREKRFEASRAISVAIKDLKADLYERWQSDLFFSNLGDMSFKGFKGTLHCEAFLASLLPSFTQHFMSDGNEYKEMSVLSDLENYGQVIGVSKRCCPSCGAFLSILMEGRGNPFVVRGNHGRMFACSLPPWTPINIVRMMNAMFGGLLLEDLAVLKKRNNGVFRDRCQSTGSDALSIDSSEGRLNLGLFM